MASMCSEKGDTEISMDPRAPALLSFQEAGVVLGGISARTVRRLADDREIIAVKVRGRIFVTVDSVHDYVRKLAVSGHNGERAGPGVPEKEQTCQTDAKTKTVYTNVMILPSTGRRIWTQAGSELDALLVSGGQSKGARKQKRS